MERCKMDIISFILSIFGSAVALLSMYFSKFKVGKLLLLPVRIYRLQGFTSGGSRYLSLTTSLTFVNTGTIFRAINDLRIRIDTPEKKNLILHWLEERDHISSVEERDEKRNFPAQPTLQAYESVNKVYTFQSHPEDTELVKSLETSDEEERFSAHIELRTTKGQWKNLRDFNIHYFGRRKIEIDFEKINPGL